MRYHDRLPRIIGALIFVGMLCANVASAEQPPSNTQNTPPALASGDDVARVSPLSDVPQNSWAYDAVAQLVKDGILKGYPDGTIKGNRPMTRYEAAVLTDRALEEIEARLTAGKSVESADIATVNKLLASFGDELKSVERHVAALQQQADATDKKMASVSAVSDATAATVRRQQFHLNTWFRVATLGQNINASAGPLPVTFNGQTYGPGAALPSGIGIAPTGTSVTGPYTSADGIVTPGAGASGGLAWGPQPNSGYSTNGNTTGQYGHGLGSQFAVLQWAGNPDDHSQYLFKLTQLDRYSSVNFYPAETPYVCLGATVGLAGASCSVANAGAQDADGYLNNFVRLEDAWYQYTSPGGIYVKAGKFLQDEGPKEITTWGLADYIDGLRIGYRTSRFNAQLGYGFGDTAAQNNLLYGLPFSGQVLFAQADYQLDKRGRTDVGGYYSNYSGFHQTLWDASAILCTGTGVAVGNAAAVPRSTSKVIPQTAGQSFSAGGCGAGYTPIVYGAPGAAAGLPVTGAYVNSGTGAQAPHDSTLGGFVVGNYGQLRIAAEATERLGIDPTTGSKWLGNTSGYFQADYGAFLPVPGVHGKFGAELGAFAAGFNGLGPGFGYYANNFPWSQFSTNFSDYYYAWAGVRRFITDSSSFGLFYVHIGMLPNTVIPAGSPQCPGCVISGDSRNALYTELNIAF